MSVEVRDVAAPSADISDADITEDSFYDDQCRKKPSWSEAVQGPCGVYLFGVTDDGFSACVALAGFRPWFYFEAPHAGWTMTQMRLLATEIGAAQRQPVGAVKVEWTVRKRIFGWEPADPATPNVVREYAFGRFSFPTPLAMRDAARKIRKREFECLKSLPQNMKMAVSEDQVQPAQQMMQLHGLCASAWVRVLAGRYSIIPLTDRVSTTQLEIGCECGAMELDERDTMSAILVASVDIEAQPQDFRSMPNCEVAGDVISYIGTTFFRIGHTEPVLRVMQVLGDATVSEEAAASANMHIECYATEAELLVAWRDLVVLRTDPDKLISYNGTTFDYKYMFGRYNRDPTKRSRFMNLGRLVLERYYDPRGHEDEEPILYKKTLSSQAFGDNELSYFVMPGRWQMDLFLYVKNTYKLSSYKLDLVFKHFLDGRGGKVVLDFPGWVQEEVARAGEVCVAPLVQSLTELGADCAEVRATFAAAQAQARAIDGGSGAEVGDESGQWMPVHRLLVSVRDELALLASPLELGDAERSEMVDVLRLLNPALDASGDDNYRKSFRLYARGPAERGQVALYCQRDCDLLVYLLERLSILPNTVKMSQVTKTLLDDIANRGQQIKVFNLIYRFATERGFVINALDVGWDPDADFIGATVIEPDAGYHTNKIATLDFASLYPSIMRGHNLCYSSLVLNPQLTAPQTLAEMEARGARFEQHELGGKRWVFQQHTTGILPNILEQLLTERKRKKREMKQYDKASMDYRLCDASQLALKISCNSVYGFTGVTVHGMLSCMPIANATTCIGRQMIDMTKAYVEEQGYVVIYGDTDSVMVDVGDVSMERAFEIGLALGNGATQLFPDTVLLEFEKVFYPYLLIKKKMYAGMKYEDSPTDPPKLDAKGLAVARRDNCQLLRDLMRTILNMVMRDADAQGAYDVLESTLMRLAYGKVSIEELEISKELKSTYVNDKQPHLTVVANMERRRALDIPQAGDRVPFVVVQGRDKRMFARAEHPNYVRSAKLPLDLAYYLDNQIEKHILRIMTPLPVPPVHALFHKVRAIIQRERLGLGTLTRFFSPIPATSAIPLAGDATQIVPTAPRSAQKKRAPPPLVQSSLTGGVPKPRAQKAKRAKKAKPTAEEAEAESAKQPSLMRFFTAVVKP